MADLTTLQIRDFFIVIIALLGFVVLIANAVKAIKELRAPSTLSSTWQRETDSKLDRDNKRLMTLEEGIKLLLKTQHVILHHLSTTNPDPKLEQLENELTDYLYNR